MFSVVFCRQKTASLQLTMFFNHLWKRLTTASSTHKRSLVSISWLWLGTIAGAGLAFATQIMLARSLGAEQFGVFSSALATVTLLSPLAGFGVAGYWLNAFGREGLNAQRWLFGSFRFLTFSTSFVLVSLLVWAWCGPHDSATSWILSILVIHICGMAAIELTSAKYQLEGRHGRLAGWQFTPHLLRFFGILLIILMGQHVLQALHIAIVFAAVALIIVVLGGYQIFLMAKGRFVLEGHTTPLKDKTLISTERPGTWTVFSASWPFGLAGLFYLIYYQSDIILLKYMVGASAAGIYSVAFVVMSSVYLFPGVVYQKFLLPKLHRWAYHDRTHFHRVYRTGNLVMLGLGLIAMVLLLLLVPVVLPLLFGVEYQGAVVLLMILALAVPFRFVSISMGTTLLTGNNVTIKVKLMGYAAIFNIFLNIPLISFFGALGAALSTVATEVLLAILYFKTARSVK